MTSKQKASGGKAGRPPEDTDTKQAGVAHESSLRQENGVKTSCCEKDAGAQKQPQKALPIPDRKIDDVSSYSSESIGKINPHLYPTSVCNFVIFLYLWS